MLPTCVLHSATVCCRMRILAHSCTQTTRHWLCFSSRSLIRRRKALLQLFPTPYQRASGSYAVVSGRRPRVSYNLLDLCYDPLHAPISPNVLSDLPGGRSSLCTRTGMRSGTTCSRSSMSFWTRDLRRAANYHHHHHHHCFTKVGSDLPLFTPPTLHTHR